MEYERLGRSGLKVSRIGVGCMSYGSSAWRPWVLDEDAARPFFVRAIEAGINYFDTADMYSMGASEEVTGRLLKELGRREELVIATKVNFPMGASADTPNMGGLSRKHILQACDDSLQRLQADVIDLYQIHWPVRSVPMFGSLYYQRSDAQVTSIHAQLEALGKLVKAGKVRAVGLSNETPYGVHEFVRLAEQHGLPRVATVQNGYSLLNRSVENALDETLHQFNVSRLA